MGFRKGFVWKFQGFSLHIEPFKKDLESFARVLCNGQGPQWDF